MKFFPAAIAAALTASVPGPAITAPEIRFCPTSELRTYPLETRRQIGSVVLHDVAIVHRGAGNFEVTSITIDLLIAGQAVDTRRLAGAALRRALSQGPAPRPASGAPRIPCVNWEEERLADTAGNPVLAPGRAFFLATQLLAFQGPRDLLRVTVHGRSGRRDVQASATIPLRSGTSRTVYRFPLRAVWWAGVGATPHGAHRWSIGEEFALDIGRLGGDGLDHRGSGTRFDDFYGYGAEVVAAADGRIVAAVDGVPENAEALRRPDETMEAYGRRFNALQRAIVSRGVAGLLGNYVVIDHGNGEYAHYAHLRPGSVRVRPGQAVREGAALGQLGSSGNSTAPHLHFQLCDGPDPLDCAGIPIAFKNLDLPWADYPRPVQSGDMLIAN